MKINIKEILLTIILAAILFLLVKLSFFQKGNTGTGISNETLVWLDSLEHSSDALKQKNADLEEKIKNLETEINSLEQSKETVRKNFSVKKIKYDSLDTNERDAEFKNYIKNTNPEFYNKLYGDK